MDVVEQIKVFSTMPDSVLYPEQHGSDIFLLDLGKLAVSYPELADAISDEEETIKAVLLALLHDEKAKLPYVKLINLPTYLTKPIVDLRVSDFGKLVCIKGKYSNISPISPFLKSMKFECPSCGNVITVQQQRDSKKKDPTKCGCGRKGKFRVIYKEFVDTFSFKILEQQDSLIRRKAWQLNAIAEGKATSCYKELLQNANARVEVIGYVKELNPLSKDLNSEYMLEINNIIIERD